MYYFLTYILYNRNNKKLENVDGYMFLDKKKKKRDIR